MNHSVRATAYKLLGKLLLGEPDAIAAARELDPFRSEFGDRADEEIASDHYGLFGREVHPYAGVFTEESALVGGRIACRVGHVAATASLSLPADESLDHIGNIMVVAGELLHRHEPEAASEMIEDCLLGWLPPWAAAAQRRAAEPWSLVVALVIELLASEPARPPARLPIAGFAVGEGTGLGGIAGALTQPAIAGAFLGLEDIRGLGRRLELPTGFGSRRLMLTNMLASAAEYDLGDALLAALAEHFDDAAGDMDALAGGAFAAWPWASRARSTAAALGRMREQLATSRSTVSYG